MDIFKLYTANDSKQTPASKESRSVGNTPLSSCRSASTQSKLLPGSLPRIQSCQEVAQILDSGKEIESLSSLNVVSKSGKAIPPSSEMSIVKKTCETNEDSCSSSASGDDEDAESSQSCDESDSLGDSINDDDVATQEQDSVPTTECNWLGFVTGMFS